MDSAAPGAGQTSEAILHCNIVASPQDSERDREFLRRGCVKATATYSAKAAATYPASLFNIVLVTDISKRIAPIKDTEPPAVAAIRLGHDRFVSPTFVTSISRVGRFRPKERGSMADLAERRAFRDPRWQTLRWQAGTSEASSRYVRTFRTEGKVVEPITFDIARSQASVFSLSYSAL